MSRLCLTAFVLLVAATPATAQFQVYVDQLEFAPTEAVTILAVPDGSGPTFSEARTADGTVVDATVRVRIVGYLHEPIAHYPADYLWLWFTAASGNIACCPFGPWWQPGLGVFFADGPTDLDGWTSFSLPLAAGGWSVGPASLIIEGAPAEWFGGDPVPPFAMRVNSPDLTGDREVNLADLQAFAQDFFGSYDFRSDLVRDGALGLPDVSVFARHYGAACVP